MNRARPGGRETDADRTGELGIAASHEGRGLFVTDLDEGDAVLTRSQCLHDAVDAVARQAEDDTNAPVNEAIHEDIGRCSRHVSLRVNCVRHAPWRVERERTRPTPAQTRDSCKDI